MSILRNNGVFLLFLLLVSLCSFFSFISADFTPHNSILGEVEEEDAAPAPNESKFPLPLARNPTRRPDILRLFAVYEGGWNVTNNHYWASVGFTGAAGFLISILWFICFGIALILHHVFGWEINFKGKNSPRSQKIHLSLLIPFLCASLGGSVIFVVAPLPAVDYIVNQFDVTAQMLRNITGYLTLAETVDVPQFELPLSALKDIYELRNRTSFAADTLTAHTKEYLSKASQLFRPMILTLLAICALMLLLLVLALVALYFLGRQHAVAVFNVIDWYLVAALFFLLGTYMVVNSAVSDSCVATQEWVDNPQAGTAISNFIPCIDDRTSNQTLSESREVVRLLVNTVNTFIHTSANTERPPDQFNYNQSGPLMPLLCFPFDYKMQARECSPQEVSLMNASLVWEKFKCMSFVDQKKCSTIGRLTPEMYTQLVQAANASVALLHFTPIVLDLQNCNILRETIMTSNSRVCPPVKRFLLISEVGLGLMATARLLNLILWLVYSKSSLYDMIMSRRAVNSAKVVPDLEK